MYEYDNEKEERKPSTYNNAQCVSLKERFS